jgi:excisionase family DNA binding protein
MLADPNSTRLIRDGKLEAVKIGKSARITTASLKQFVESLPASAGGSPIKRADSQPEAIRTTRA